MRGSTREKWGFGENSQAQRGLFGEGQVSGEWNKQIYGVHKLEPVTKIRPTIDVTDKQTRGQLSFGRLGASPHA